MLKDITIGQYLPGNSCVHKLDPRLKIILLIVYIVALFIGSNPLGIIISVIFIIIAYMAAKIPLKMIWKSIKPLLFILLFTSILNLFLVSSEDARVLVSAGPFSITDKGLITAVLMPVRVVSLVAATSLLTYTTSPIVLTDAIERLLSPLEIIHFPAHELAMMMTIALRFIPTLIEETEKIMNAQKARGAQLDSGGFINRIKALVPILIPLFISAFRRAEELATAMECRCYNGGANRTRLRQLHITKSDIKMTVFCLIIFTFIILSNFIVPSLV